MYFLLLMVSKSRRIALAKKIRKEKIRVIQRIKKPSTTKGDYNESLRRIKWERFNLNPVVGRISMRPLKDRYDPFPDIIKDSILKERKEHARKVSRKEDIQFEKDIRPFQKFTNYTPEHIESRQNWLNFFRD